LAVLTPLLRRPQQAKADAAENRAALRDMSDQIRANTRAVLSLLNERGGGPAPAGA
jgi:hypothetical protein